MSPISGVGIAHLMGRNDGDTCGKAGECLLEMLGVEGWGCAIHPAIVGSFDPAFRLFKRLLSLKSLGRHKVHMRM
jgi:hypothetical protein